MKLAYTAILAVLLLSGAPALAQIHNGTDGVTPGVKVPDPNAPGTLRSGDGSGWNTRFHDRQRHQLLERGAVRRARRPLVDGQYRPAAGAELAVGRSNR